MPGEGETNGLSNPVAKPFVDFWTDYLKQANDATREFFNDLDDNTNAKTLQRKWFDAVAKSMDAYMRSPVFLQAMKHKADTVVKAKQQFDDLATEIARNANIPTAGDISGLFERLHSVEEKILRRLGRIDEQLTAIEQNIGSRKLMQNS
jgi:hypothetical protein